MQKALLFFTIQRNYVHLVLVEEVESDHGLFKDRNKYVSKAILIQTLVKACVLDG